MNSVNRKSVVALCNRCQRELGPRRNLRPQWNLEYLQRSGASDGMVDDSPPDPRAEAIRRKKERRERGKIIRELIQSGDILGAQRFAFTTIALPSQSEDCPDCLKLNARVA